MIIFVDGNIGGSSEEVRIFGSEFQKIADLQFGHTSKTRIHGYGINLTSNPFLKEDAITKFRVTSFWWHGCLDEPRRMHLPPRLKKLHVFEMEDQVSTNETESKKKNGYVYVY